MAQTKKDTPNVKSKTDMNKSTKSGSSKKASKNKTVQGARRNQIEMHPKMKRITSLGHVYENATTAVVVFGRMNPPTVGHERLVTEAVRIAKDIGGYPMVILSPTNNKSNPLTDSQKHAFVTEAFSDIIDVRPEMFSNPITMLQVVENSGFTDLIWVTGSDQENDYSRILENYNGVDFNFDMPTVISLSRDDSQYSHSISATQMREAAEQNDFNTFKNGVPTNLQENAQVLFEQVQHGQELNRSGNPFINTLRDGFQNVR